MAADMTHEYDYFFRSMIVARMNEASLLLLKCHDSEQTTWALRADNAACALPTEVRDERAAARFTRNAIDDALF